jgi:hypothetical protein
MVNKTMFEDAFPQDNQVGGSHYKFLRFNLTNLYLKMIYLFFKVM